ncbi:RlpA-like double-psi beta-barrel-protein domain-containing protein-containing protein [Mycena galopus ATCC 62051]|nr:RlpA-like double-psi beta-barrel-protein domain-containing protein-containing protein [Mycena galopus ATCC 62051]
MFAILLFISSTFFGLAYSAPLQSRATTFTGNGTFFQPGLGACGKTNTANDLIVAVGHGEFDAFPGAGPNPTTNPICGKKIKATSGGNSVTVTVVDRCVSCSGAADLDFSEAAFAKLAALVIGRIDGVKWHFV